ncbi:uncharacterized protein J4E88_007106 [Alternaria novae-zelandiae]|uniref:uncharacterized protein n=1 Tax=Alternaria novae-zelandiae TaxID=430562 RepID=UPI0020C3FD21|nr:uncharacterized protein J4E88_007106 [Alternaria novae-zelandiae]KAI4677298.1 hypothetical protein J4E88_007106 [Alternaria novae-zelandiae]
MPPKRAGLDPDAASSAEESPNARSARNTDSPNPRAGRTSTPVLQSSNVSANTRKGRRGNSPRSEDNANESQSVYEHLEAQRQELSQEIKDTKEKAEIPDFEEHLTNRARARDKNAGNRIALVRAANKAVGGQEKFDRVVRREAHAARTHATALYEDFQYYQTPEFRSQYLQDIDKVKDRIQQSIRDGQPPGLLSGDDAYDKVLRPILKSLEDDKVGQTETLDYDNMGPHHLHVRIPRAKSQAVGLGRPRVPPIDPPINLKLDVEAIEKRRKKVEDENKDDKMAESHSERRARETGLSEGLPSDSHVNDALATANNLSRTRLESGLFISAGETWDDWKTSDERDAPNELYDPPTEEEMPDDDSDSSDDENDLFAISYRECSGLAGFPRGGGGGDDDDGGSDDDGNSEKGEKKDTNDPGAPANPAGGPPTGSEPRPQSPRKKAKEHDYTQYNRPQVRTALKYREQAQSAQYVTELHKRANDYDDNPKQPGTIHHYILKDRSVANRLEKRITELGEGWSTEYKKELDEQNKNGEQVDTDVSEENSPASTGKGKAKKTSKSKEKKKTQPKRKSKK